LPNSGSSLLAQNALAIYSSNSLSNLNAGLIKAGGGLDLSALGDINSIGSAISGKPSSWKAWAAASTTSLKRSPDSEAMSKAQTIEYGKSQGVTVKVTQVK
jgi:hypothetical protein